MSKRSVILKLVVNTENTQKSNNEDNNEDNNDDDEDEESKLNLTNEHD